MLGYFCNFILLAAQKTKIKKNKRKKMPGNIIILHIRTKNYDHLMYDSWDMIYDGQTEKVTYRGGCPT